MQQPSRMTRAKRAQLSAFIQAKRATDDRGARRHSSTTIEARGPVGQIFSPAKHGLTWGQCKLAAWLLERANTRRPLTGSPQQVQFRRALRIAGIISSVKGHRAGNSRFARSLQGHHGGNTLRDHALHHLRAIAPIGLFAIRIARQRRQAEAYFEATGEVLPIGAKPAPSPETQRIQDLTTIWETQQWQMQRAEHLRW